jgi:hypothetical protein
MKERSSLKVGGWYAGGWKEANPLFLRFINIIDKTLSLLSSLPLAQAYPIFKYWAGTLGGEKAYLSYRFNG